MLALVVADRDEVGLVDQDVAGHQDRVAEESGRDGLLLVALLLELRHAAQLAEGGDARQQPGRFRMRRHVALEEDRRALRVEPGCEEHGREIERRLAELRRFVGDGDRVQVDNADEGLALFLGRGVLTKTAAEVAEVLGPCGLDAGEDARHFGLKYRN